MRLGPPHLLTDRLRRRGRRLPRRLLAILFLLLAAWLVWPYVTLWRLGHLVSTRPPSALSTIVDIDSVRDEILRRLNKDENSSIGAVSDAFIDWIERGIRQPGNAALRQTVTREWVHGLLAARLADNRGLFGHLGYAFYEPPDGFLARIDSTEIGPLYLRMQPGLGGWQVTAIYY